jgi:hypothetical protein
MSFGTVQDCARPRIRVQLKVGVQRGFEFLDGVQGGGWLLIRPSPITQKPRANQTVAVGPIRLSGPQAARKCAAPAPVRLVAPLPAGRGQPSTR